MDLAACVCRFVAHLYLQCTYRPRVLFEVYLEPTVLQAVLYGVCMHVYVCVAPVVQV